jgi:Family of unknown function (DUF6152)
MPRRFFLLAANAVLFASGLPVLAHHAFSNEYDETKPMTLEGVVTRIDWENPHVHYYVDVAQEDGSVVNWACETGGPNRLARRGWTRDSLKVGDRVTVHAFPSKDSSHAADGRKVTLANGQTIGTEPAGK